MRMESSGKEENEQTEMAMARRRKWARRVRIIDALL
jgi:hypothetical protein